MKYNSKNNEHQANQKRTAKSIVVKLGTSVLTGGELTLDQSRMVDLVRQCAMLQSQGHRVVICTSAAVAVGRSRLGNPNLPPGIASKQLLAAVGQSRLMLTWERLFEIYNINVGQILLSHADVVNPQRFLNARDVLTALLDNGIVPIINENDAIATEELRVGDNDNLSALVATLIQANLLLLLTDQQGLFTKDPLTNSDARLIEEVQTIDEKVRGLAGGNSSSGLGVGGMITKIEAAAKARQAGADVIIASGRGPDVILRAVAGEQVGTRFPVQENRSETRLGNRRRWILTGARPTGKLIIDQGATKALCYQGSSLLPVGLLRVEGTFVRGDTVNVLDEAGALLARGIASYGGQELEKIIGCRSDEIEKRLGYMYSQTVIHRDDMILLKE